MANKGFSLIELLVTIFIIALLMFLGMRAYNEQRAKTYLTWAKSEMNNMAQFMKTARNYDGYYHQYIYAAGYQPKGKVYASVGTAAAPGTNCCNKYPDPGTSPCVKDGRSGFLYYNCDNSALHKATDNIEICNNSSYSGSCQMDSGLSALKTSDFSTCTPSPSTWCNCTNFTVGAITFDGRELSINELGKLCLD